MSPWPPRPNRSGADERSRAEAGSVLADALVGLAVIVITLTLASEAVQSGLIRAHREEQVRWAVLEARSRLAEVGADIPAREGRSGGRDGPLVWSLDVTPSASAPGLLEARVQVDDSQGQALTSMRTLARIGP